MRTEEEAASGSDSEADWVAEASPPSPSSVDEDEGEEQADHEGEGEEFVFGRSAVPDDGRLFASIDSWRRTMNSIGELQEMLDESGMEPALRHVHSAEEALRAVLVALGVARGVVELDAGRGIEDRGMRVSDEVA